MMFKRLRITGRNKIRHGIAALMAAVLLMGIPVSAAKWGDFTDLQDKTEEWYYTNGELPKAIELGLFNGQSEDYFGVDEEITRAEFVTALSRLCGADVAGYTHGHFIDVVTSDWHYEYVSWAYKEGLVSGTSENEFSPDRPVNRQEMSKMLANAIEIIFEKKLTTEGAATFKDQDQIDEWAIPFVQKCNVAGIFLGDEGYFYPQQYAPRHQAACVFYRCHTMMEAEKPETPPATDPENPPATEPELPPVDPADYGLTVSGFDLDFHVDTDYYLAQPADFQNCKLLSYKGFKEFKVSVEEYAGYYPYKNKAYKMGDTLLLGNGRAKIVIDATLENGETRKYLIALTDPKAADYAYSRVKIRTESSAAMYAKPDVKSSVLYRFFDNARVYYLKTEGDFCLVEQRNTGKIGYVEKKYIQWNWKDTEMPDRYKTAIEALQAAHPNWTFTFVDVEMTYEEVLKEYGAANEEYIDPLNYLAEDKIFAMMNIDVYDQETWNDEGIKAIWVNEKAISKEEAVTYFNMASQSLMMNPYYVASRAALESGYGTSSYAKGMSSVSKVTIQDDNIVVNGVSLPKGSYHETLDLGGTYYNLYGIRAVSACPNNGMAYAASRNWNTLQRSIVEGANWIKDSYLDRGAITPYFFRFRGFQNLSYMDDPKAPLKEASILKRAFTDPNAKAHFVIPVYENMPTA